MEVATVSGVVLYATTKRELGADASEACELLITTSGGGVPACRRPICCASFLPLIDYSLGVGDEVPLTAKDW